MLIIRFARRGRKGQAFFDLVAAEKSRPVKKKFINKLGYLNPHPESGKGEFVFDKEAVEKYINNGAQVSQSAARLLAKNGCELAGKFIEQRVSKPKKTEAPKEEPVAEEAPAEEAATEDAPTETTEETATQADTPAEEPAAEAEAPAEEPKAEEAPATEEASAEADAPAEEEKAA